MIHASTGEEALACKSHVAEFSPISGCPKGRRSRGALPEHDPEPPVIYATDFSPATTRPVPGPHPEEALPSGRDRPDGDGARRGEADVIELAWSLGSRTARTSA